MERAPRLGATIPDPWTDNMGHTRMPVPEAARWDTRSEGLDENTITQDGAAFLPLDTTTRLHCILKPSGLQMAPLFTEQRKR